MKESFTEFQTHFNNSEIRLQNKDLGETFYKFDFHLYEKDIKSEKEISEFSNESQIIVIDKCEGSDQKEYFFICFDYHLILVEGNQNLTDSLLSKISKYGESEKHYLYRHPISEKLSQPRNDFFLIEQKNRKISSSSEDKTFLYEIEIFSSKFYINDPKIGSILMNIVRSMSGFLIKKSYKKLREKYESNNYEDFADEQKKIDLKKEEFLRLREVGKGSLGSVELIYHIKREELFALKIPNDDASEWKELIERESSRYLKIDHPFICHYYGSVSIDHKKCLLLEFIEGKTLDKFNLKSLKEDEKCRIIFKLILTIQYLHAKGFIYRDLYLDNIIISSMNDPILIDFDRLIQTDDTTKEEQKTLNFQKIQLPELERCEYFTSKSDILLLGFIIYYIYYEKIPTHNIQHERVNKQLFYDISSIHKKSEAYFFSACFSIEPNERPTINELLYLFYEYFRVYIKVTGIKNYKMFMIFLNNTLNEKFNLYLLGEFYLIIDIPFRDISKAIHYYSLAADQNFLKAQTRLGDIYYESKYTLFKNIDKGIHYYSLAADQNFLEAQIKLGDIYYEYKYILRSISKAIHYYSLAADQNSLETQIKLGDIYYEGEYVPRDTNKAIHYYSLAANQNNSYALFQLGYIYKEGKYVPRDIDKAIHYFQLASYDPDYSIEIKLESVFKELDCNIISINLEKLQKEYESMRNDIKSDTIHKLYSNFIFSHYKFPNTDDDHILFIYKAKLFFYLKNYKFIVFDIKYSKSIEKSSYSQIVEVIICIENKCIIVENINITAIEEIIKKLEGQNLEIINISSALKENCKPKEDIFMKEEIANFESKFKDEIKNNKFVKQTISSIITYSVHRFFYPKKYFKDQSFFKYSDKEIEENEIQASINDILCSSDEDETFERRMRDIVKRIKDNEHQIIQKREFKEEEFIVLRNITCKEESSISLVIHRDSLHIFAMKKIKNIKHKTKEIEHEINFCSNYSHRVFTPFYGFVKSENNDDIIGFIYKYMSNNSLSSYLSSKKAYKKKDEDEDDIFIMTTILRISSGIEYLQSKSLIHRDLKPSNILLDHDFIPYISDFETIRSMNDESKSTPMTNDLGSLLYTSPEQDDGGELTYATDIYSFGLIIYFLYERENMFDTNLISIFDKKRNYDIKSILKSSTNVNNLYKKCVKFEQTARPTINEIKTIIIDEIKSFCYLDQYFQMIKTDDIFQLALQFMYENILISIENTENSDTYFKSIIIKRNYLKAKEYYGLSAKQNNSTAFDYLGNLYYSGEGVKRDYLKAKECYELSAKQNNSAALNKLGNHYYNGEGVKQDYLKAKEYYELSAKQNNLDAFNYLGQLYQYGKGVKQDYLKAKEYYELSAKQNNSYAFNNLGNLYINGLGVAKDYLKAKEYYELSAKQGDIFSLYVLGNFYQSGLGVDKNFTEAKKYYEMAAEKGNYLAYIQLGDMYFKGEGVEQNYIKARNFYEVAAEINNMDALFKLGDIYLNGYGVERDYHKAIKYYELSAKQNNADALFFLGTHYSSNEICDRNISKSIENYLKCKQIERGDIVIYYSKEKGIVRTFRNNRYRHRAMNDLGLIYLLDFEDFEKGNEYIKESAFSEYPFGQNNFGLINEIYLGEILKAEHFYKRSSEHCFSLAEYNLGYLKEKSGREEESIEYYIKTSEYEDEPLIFRDIEHQDIRLTISKTFVVCFTNLKLFEYYFNKGNSDESRKYFIKSFSKLTIKEKEKDEDEEYSYQFELRFDHNDVQKSISYLKTFIFNFPSFNLFNQPSLKTILQYLKIKNENDQENKHRKRSKKFKKSKRKTESIKNHSIHRAMKEENFYHKIKLSNMNENEEHDDEEEEIGGCANEGVTIFSDPGEFIDFVYKNEQQKTILIESIKDIIQSMKEILYTPPYVILFGRLHIRKRKDCYKEIDELFPHRKEINELFYEGLDIEEFQYHKT